MHRFYLSGQRSFDNRGCEAIIRSTVGLLNGEFSKPEILVPSDNVLVDKALWPDASAEGVQFVPAYFPVWARYWVNFQRLPIPFVKQVGWPFPMPRSLRKTFSKMDAVLSVGGDNYSLDYRIPSPLMGMDGLAMRTGKPVILWGASVGPFESEPYFVAAIKNHLKKMHLIAVRESVSEAYLRNDLGLSNVTRVADPAFTLAPQPTDFNHFWPDKAESGVLGINISPLLARYRKGRRDLIEEVVLFIQHVVQKLDLSVLLVPHVMPSKGSRKNSDAAYLQGVLDRTGSMGNRVRLMDSRLNAAKIKYVVSHCRYFVGARTHATIAAMSSLVPTISIAYSVKAKGINRDLFDHLDYVLETPRVDSFSLLEKLNLLISKENEIKAHLTRRIARIQEMARLGAKQLKTIVRKNG